MILNIRSTHGGGKSTAVVKLMQAHIVQPLWPNPRTTKPEAYALTGYKKDALPIFVIGPYEAACGGVDAIQPYNRIWPLVQKYAKRGHVVFEGALVSSCVGSLGAAMAKRKDCVVAYLDTPLQTCLDRIAKRRAKKGDTRPLNPTNTNNKFKSVAGTRAKFEALGVRCVTIKHKKAVDQLLELLYGASA